MGDVPGGFEVVKRLASGGVAEVFLGHRPGEASNLVLKVLRPEVTADYDPGRFFDEARMCARLDHPGVVKHLGVSQLADGRPCLVTEYLEGQTLQDHLRQKGPLLPEELVRLAGALCEALDYVHAQGIVHRDLKPDNVFLVGDQVGQPKLLDFGLARFRGPRAVRTANGTLLVTPEYAAPECIDGAPADAKSDLYALGVLFYECLSGAPPFLGPNPTELLLMHQRQAPLPLGGKGQVLDAVIQRLLAKRPAERYASAKEAAAALSQALARATAPQADEGTARVGEVLGQYELVKLLGEGSMGQVFLARHARLGRQVAIKVLRAEHARSHELTARFFHEARAVNEINHEHIVEIFDFVEELLPSGESRAYCVMELLVGESLTARLQAAPLGVARTVAVAKQVAGALAAAHARNIVHRDIKPDNIFLAQRSGTTDYVKVLDFGVAKLLKPVGELPTHATAPAAIIGTPAYMAPEQAAGLEVDPRTDVYALGTVLYECLTGKPPFEAPSFGQLVVHIITRPAPALPEQTASGEPIPPALRALVARCLSKEAQSRPQDMAELARELDGILQPDAPVIAPAPIPLQAVVAPPPQPARTGLYAAGGLGALALLGLGVALLKPSAPAPQPAPQPAPAQVVAPPQPAPVAPTQPAQPEQVTIQVTSDPPGARVLRTDTNQALGVTPLTARLPRAEAELPLRLELEGRNPAERKIRLDANTSIQVELSQAARVKQAHSARGGEKKEKVSRDGVLDPFEN